jgi:hypothetical protein
MMDVADPKKIASVAKALDTAGKNDKEDDYGLAGDDHDFGDEDDVDDDDEPIGWQPLSRKRLRVGSTTVESTEDIPNDVNSLCLAELRECRDNVRPFQSQHLY